VASSGKYLVRSAAIRFRRRLRESEAAFIVLALLAGLAAGILTNAQQFLAHGIQHFFYGVTINRLSALGSIHHPWRLLALPTGGLLLVFMARWLHRRRRTLIDVVEANALHGGRLPLSDSLIIAGQTIVSNGAGASVGLEAAYAQMGGGIASALGQWFAAPRGSAHADRGRGRRGRRRGFRRAIGRRVLCLRDRNLHPGRDRTGGHGRVVRRLVTRLLGVEPYLIATTADRVLHTPDYLVYAALGLVCAFMGIVVMRLVTAMELVVQAWTRIGVCGR
jgi:CIC family chloride channel protein